jgi:hypothetical protein
MPVVVNEFATTGFLVESDDLGSRPDWVCFVSGQENWLRSAREALTSANWALASFGESPSQLTRNNLALIGQKEERGGIGFGRRFGIWL